MDSQTLANRLFCAKRLRGDILSKGQCLEFLGKAFDFANDFAYGVEQDRLKITMCAPLRRLQQKTQVFPLDVKAASRNRLTHSLEVAQYTRLITYAIAKRVESFRQIIHPMASALHNAALLHDIGNPPFGHFGESLIREWLKSAVNNPHIKAEIKDTEVDDLLTFNGNAQGLRLVHSIQDLNLTLGQYASVIKVPYTVKELILGKGKGSSGNGIHQDFYSWSYSNAGVFLSELNVLESVRHNCERDTRHPFATIIEYSDDLAYVLADLEDAYDRGLYDKHTIISLCEQMVNYTELEPLRELLNVNKVKSLFKSNKTEALFYLRDVVSMAFVDDVARAISNNLESFVETGEPDFSSGDYPGITALKLLKNFETINVYNHFEVQTLDLSGASYIKSLFGTYERLLLETKEDFFKELNAQGGDPFCMRIASRISRRHKGAYLKGLEQERFSEMYLRIRLLVDYISGMTDTFCESEFKILNGQK
ncbi:MAG: dNTP triphosphohydrolase [Succinatimonas sp.]|jgi:dGTPase|nr:dNTP triphosphohydrolase [Succinivibrio sp.]MCI6906230.1 dNTP triphosphohydrolase [Succinatimonas sp.]MDD5868079.1 dNTP triphosphohydrolase [Succinatimonas sp.]MDY5722205.1 dNTP triphosphohydrolase [Succinivibrio sp.]